MQPYLFDDIIRSIVMGGLFCVVYFSFSIVRHYMKILKIRYGNSKKLPLHIVEIGISYMLASIFICITIGLRYRQAISWPALFGVVIVSLGAHALYIMRSHLKDELSYPYTKT